MKKLFLGAVIIIVSFSSCIKVYYDEIATNKSTLVNRNCVLISSDIPADITISFCSYSNGQNRIEKKDVKTPYLLELGTASVVYDSLNMMRFAGGSCKRTLIRGEKRIRHIYTEKGAEYLHIQNNSNYILSVAVVGTQELRPNRQSALDHETVTSYPIPIYKGVPLLYLLKPDITPRLNIFYKEVLEYRKDNYEFGYIIKEGKKRICLSPENLKRIVGEEVPFSVDKAMSLYRLKEYNLFLDYSDWSIHNLDPKLKNFGFYCLATTLFWQIEPSQTWCNTGSIPLFPQDFNQQNELL